MSGAEEHAGCAAAVAYQRAIFSGTRGHLNEEDLRRVAWAVVGLRAENYGIGDCPTGVDAYLLQLLHKPLIFEASWQTLGKRAGPERNGRMVRWAAERGGVLLAFPSPESRGTWDCIRQAVAAGLRVVIEPIGRCAAARSGKRGGER